MLTHRKGDGLGLTEDRRHAIVVPFTIPGRWIFFPEMGLNRLGDKVLARIHKSFRYKISNFVVDTLVTTLLPIS